MALISIKNIDEIRKDKGEKAFVLFYKSGTPNSDCAYDNLARINDATIYTVDVNDVRNLHQHFGVNSVPSFVILKDGKVQNIVKGCQTDNYFSQIINEEASNVSNSGDKSQKRVVVYSTPTCTYCNKLKQYFNKHGVKYTDINVATNQTAAMEMFRKSGQRGVPQTEIGGQMIVGFDTRRLSRILNIPTE